MATYLVEEDKLKGEYKEVFEKIESYSIFLSIDAEINEDMMMNLVDMLYTAQIEGKPVEKIVGNDVEKFCKEYFQDIDKNPLMVFIKNIPHTFYVVAWGIFILSIIEFLDLPKFTYSEIKKVTIDVSGLVLGWMLGCIVSCVIFYFVRGIILKIKKLNSTVVAFVCLAGVFVIGCTAVVLAEEKSIKIPVIYAFVVSFIYILIYKGINLYKRYKETGSIKKVKKKGPIKEVWDEAYKSSTKMMPVELKKIWIKKNKKRVKKGKPEITEKEYTEKFRNDSKKLIFVDIGILIFYSIAYVSMIASSLKEDSIGITILSAIIIFIIFAILFKFGSTIQMRKEREEILRRCDEEGITIIELAGILEREAEGESENN